MCRTDKNNINFYSSNIETIQLRHRAVTLVKHRAAHAGGQYGIHFGGQGPHGTGGVHIVILHGGGHATQIGGTHG